MFYKPVARRSYMILRTSMLQCFRDGYKDSKDSVIDYKTTNVMLFFCVALRRVSMGGFPLAEVVLLWQSVFNFPN